MNEDSLPLIDYLVVIISIVVFIAVGASFTRRQQSTDKYFT